MQRDMLFVFALWWRYVPQCIFVGSVLIDFHMESDMAAFNWPVTRDWKKLVTVSWCPYLIFSFPETLDHISVLTFSSI